MRLVPALVSGPLRLSNRYRNDFDRDIPILETGSIDRGRFDIDSGAPVPGAGAVAYEESIWSRLTGEN